MTYSENTVDVFVHVLKEKLGGQWDSDGNVISGRGRFQFFPYRVEILYKTDGNDVQTQLRSVSIGRGWLGWILFFIAIAQIVSFPVIGFLILRVLGAIIGAILAFISIRLLGAARTKASQDLRLKVNQILGEADFLSS